MGESKAAWITNAAATVATDFPATIALCWYEQPNQAGWNVTSSPAALAAWRRAFVGAPVFQGRLP